MPVQLPLHANRNVLPGILIVLAFLVGCNSPLPPAPPPQAPSGMFYYQQAFQIWADARQKDLRGDAWNAQLDRIVTLLQHAAEADTGNALYLTKLSDFLLSSNAASTSQADELLTRSYRITQYWPGYWLGKCEISLRQNNVNQAEQALAGAEASVSELQDKSPDNSASQTSLAARGLWGSWLVLDAKWGVDGSCFTANDIASIDQAVARTKARISLYRFKIAGMRGADSGRLVAMLRDSLRYDADYLPARIGLAKFMQIQGQYQAAEAQLVAFMAPQTPLAANNGTIQLELADIYKDWYVNGDHGHVQFALGRKLYDEVIVKHPDDVAAVIGLAELLAARTGADATDDPRDRGYRHGVSYLVSPADLLDQAVKGGADEPSSPAPIRAAVARVRALLNPNGK